MGIGVSIFLMAVGAILAFAVNVSAEGINLDTVGVILIVLGLVGLLASLVFWDDWTPRRRAVGYDDGRDVIVRRRRPRIVEIDDDAGGRRGRGAARGRAAPGDDPSHELRRFLIRWGSPTPVGTGCARRRNSGGVLFRADLQAGGRQGGGRHASARYEAAAERPVVHGGRSAGRAAGLEHRPGRPRPLWRPPPPPPPLGGRRR